MNHSKFLPIVTMIIVSCGVLLANSYAQEATLQTSKTEKIYLQIQVRDPDGKLVAYIEPTLLYVYHPELVDKYFDEKPNKSIITINGKKFEQIQFEENGRFDKYHAFARYVMFSHIDGKTTSLLTMIHDGYPVAPGYTFKAIWTVIRPAD